MEPECLRLEPELKNGSYRPGRYRDIVVRDPKRRVVSAAPFRDRVVHHALCAVLEPIFERGFIFDSDANRVGKGTHRAVARYEHFRDQHRGGLAWVLPTDIWRCFPAVDHAILLGCTARRVACPQTLALCRTIVAGSNAQEPVEHCFPGDDLCTPFERRRGLPLGNLTSQFFANVYLDALDHWATEVLRQPYLRYVDDIAAFARTEAELLDAQARMAQWLEGWRLRLHPGSLERSQCPATGTRRTTGTTTPAFASPARPLARVRALHEVGSAPAGGPGAPGSARYPAPALVLLAGSGGGGFRRSDSRFVV
jgi:RNA-directed DNA polymerase